MTCPALYPIHSHHEYDAVIVRRWCLRYWCDAHCETCDPTRQPPASTPERSPTRADDGIEFGCLSCTLPECDDTDPRCPYSARLELNRERTRRSNHSQRKQCPVCGKFILNASSTCVSHTWYTERALDQVAREAKALRENPRAFIAAWWEGGQE